MYYSDIVINIFFDLLAQLLIRKELSEPKLSQINIPLLHLS